MQHSSAASWAIYGKTYSASIHVQAQQNSKLPVGRYTPKTNKDLYNLRSNWIEKKMIQWAGWQNVENPLN